jgi:hypothetical protein
VSIHETKNKAIERTRQDVLARSPLIQAGDPFGDHRRVALDRDDQRHVHSHAIGNDGADSWQVRLGRQEVDDVVNPVEEDIPQADGLAIVPPVRANPRFRLTHRSSMPVRACGRRR